MAVVIAQAACEVGTEQVMTVLLKKKGMAIIAEPLLSAFRPFDITRDRLQKLYNALSGQQIQKEKTFWPKLIKHYKRRNDVVHKGVSCSRSEAGESLDAVQRYIERAKR